MLSLTGQAKGAAALMGSARKGQSSHVAEFSSAGDLARSREVEFSQDSGVAHASGPSMEHSACLPTTHRTEGSDAATLHYRTLA